MFAASAAAAASEVARNNLREDWRRHEERLRLIGEPGVALPELYAAREPEVIESEAHSRRLAMLRVLSGAGNGALADFVTVRYPTRPQAVLDAADFVRAAGTGELLVRARGVVRFYEVEESFIASVDSAGRDVVLDLRVESTPRGAAFRLKTLSGVARSTTTDDVVPNVYRGLYLYEVSLPGYKPVVDTANLVDSRIGEIKCQLRRVAEQGESPPCQVH